jgi:predicted outer membrane protein
MKLEERRSADTILDGASGKALMRVTALCVFCSLFSLACGGNPPGDAAVDDATNDANGDKNGKGKGDGGKQKEQEIKTEGQALKVLLDFSDTQIAEAKVGAEKTHSPDVKTLAEGLESDYASTIERLKTIASDKGIKASKNNMADRLKFNSTSQINHIENVMPGMVDNAYISRVQNAHKEIITQIDEAIVPVLVDEDLKAEVAVIRDDATRHLADANAVGETVKDEGAALPPLAGGGGAPFGDAGAGGGKPGPAVGPNGEHVPELNPNQMPGQAPAAAGRDGGV